MADNTQYDDQTVSDEGDMTSGDDSSAQASAGQGGGEPSAAMQKAMQAGHKFLPQAKNFDIPDQVYEKYPELINLILETESMNDEERQYWFQIMPIMTDDQVQKFKEILVTEKDQLAKLDSEYEQELNRLNEKHMLEWKEFEVKEKRRAIEEAEAAESGEEKAKQEALLKQLEDV